MRAHLSAPKRAGCISNAIKRVESAIFIFPNLIDRFIKFKLFRGIIETFFLEVGIIGLTKAGRLFAIQTMRDSQNLECFRKQLQESLEEIEQYLAKTAESAEAVSPDKGLGRLSRMERCRTNNSFLRHVVAKKCKKSRFSPPYNA